MAEAGVPITVAGQPLVADLSGALHWPAATTVVFADLHFEKGSAFAERGTLLPPYDTRATIAKMAEVLARLRPDRVICLGDSFHDGEGVARMAADDRGRLSTLTAGRDWIWIAGNHDPMPPGELGGRVMAEALLDGLTFRHEPRADAAAGEVAGHLHPKATVKVRAKRITRPCFVGDGRRLLLPAFGAFTGGLDATDGAIRSLFAEGFTAHLLGDRHIHSFPSTGLAPAPLYW
ncbi:MAG: ligase-associated DNA damage response endonuclease PdeM [Alphaproteobacteria bacterium]|nr:ligase-associated DNA damage response endonuclease PdeM [Alphaproteobacteria bacterium]